ncbi:hypothetical protein N0V92_004558 [Colletotrichum tropicale]|nr:hypothetical protein N0V92_004558 [Colletotrichum tropicale]
MHRRDCTNDTHQTPEPTHSDFRMAGTEKEETFRRFLDEMSGESRDHSIRQVLELRTRDYFQSIDAGRIDEVTPWYAENITWIERFKNPIRIHKGKEEVVARQEKNVASLKQNGQTMFTVPISIIVDRNRITCRAERFTQESEKIEMKTFVIIFDLDETGRVTRRENRIVKKPVVIRDRTIDELLAESKKKQNDMNIDYAA